tara:strand:- start:393 stop:680 length:288 start_codon:yes stop_codon:yes gene_type:complete
MKDTVTEHTFTNEMIKHGFSYEGTKALFEYFEQYEQDCDTELEFDPIAFRCQYDEYENIEEVKKNYQDIETLEDLEQNTTVIQIPDSDKLIISAY